MTQTKDVPGSPRPRFVRRTFRALRLYNYRLFFISQVVSMSGTWMQSVAQSWLVLQITGCIQVPLIETTWEMKNRR